MTTKIQQISGASFSLSSPSPSFTTFSSENIADIAARVIKELNLSLDDDFYSDFALNDASHQNDTVEKEQQEEEIKSSEDEESEFEFAIVSGEDNSSLISADEIFSNGKIKPMFHVFNTDLIYGYGYEYEYDYNNGAPPQTLGLPLRKLLQESQNGNGNSSSQADDLSGIPSGTFCVWTPKKKEEVMKMRKKSKSTGSSKRWRIKDLLYRSNSDGKDRFVFLSPPNNQNHNHNRNRNHNHNHNCNRNRKTINGNDNGDLKKKSGFHGEKKKSYLPYRQDLVGLFANVNGISRTVPVRPF